MPSIKCKLNSGPQAFKASPIPTQPHPHSYSAQLVTKAPKALTLQISYSFLSGPTPITACMAMTLIFVLSS